MTTIDYQKQTLTIDVRPANIVGIAPANTFPPNIYAIDPEEKRIRAIAANNLCPIERIEIRCDLLSKEEKQKRLIKLHVATKKDHGGSRDEYGWKKIKIDLSQEIYNIEKIYIASARDLQRINKPISAEHRFKSNLKTTYLEDYKQRQAGIEKMFCNLKKIIEARLLGNDIFELRASRSFKCLYKRRPLYCDGSFVVEGKKIEVHKEVFISQSLYFDTLFNSNFKESVQQTPIEMKELKYSIFEMVVQFLYTATICINEETIVEVYQAADRFQLDKLQEFCTPSFIQYRLSQMQEQTGALQNLKEKLEVACYNAEISAKDMQKMYSDSDEIKELNERYALLEESLNQMGTLPAKEA